LKFENRSEIIQLNKKLICADVDKESNNQNDMMM